MLATAARPHSVRGQLESAHKSEAAEPMVRRPAPEEEGVVRAAPALRRPGFLTALMRALSAFNV